MEELERFDHRIGDTEGVVNYPLCIDRITLAALFVEKEDYIKVSLRSKGDVSVSDVARKYYNGGGHHNASGGNSYVNMDDTLTGFEKILPHLFQGIPS